MAYDGWYYTLITFDYENDRWCIEFGDWNKDLVTEERKLSYGDLHRWEWAIIHSKGSQAEIDEKVSRYPKPTR